MRRVRLAVFSMALVGCLGPALGAAQTPSKPAVIGRLSPGAGDILQGPMLRAFHEAMASLGHAEGRSYVVEQRLAEGDPARLPALAAELVRIKPDVIIASSIAVPVMRQATADIPIVTAAFSGDPVQTGLAASLARPGGNVTGLTTQIEDIRPKQLELLRDIVPRLSRVVVLYNPASTATPEGLQTIVALGAARGVKVTAAAAADPQAIEAAFAAARAANADGIIVHPDPALMDRQRVQIAELALRHRLASAFSYRLYVEAGGLVSYAPDLIDIHRRAATFVDKILKGANPGELPIEQPTKFEMAVNVKTAKILGLSVPQSILLSADEVIE